MAFWFRSAWLQTDTPLPSTTLTLARSLPSGHTAQLPAHLFFLLTHLLIHLSIYLMNMVYTLTLYQAWGTELPTAWAQALTSQMLPSKKINIECQLWGT